MSEGHRTPDEDEAPEIRSPRSSAAGPASIRSTIKHISGELGLVRGFRILSKVNQKNGFDCPGCAWPDPDDERSTFEYCENGAKAVAEEATLRRVTPKFFSDHAISDLASRSDHWLGKQGRLTHPVVKRVGSDHYEPLDWAEAFGMIAETLAGLESPAEASFYASGRTSNEAAFLYQLFVRMYGTNNLPDCSNMCHESSGVGLKEVIGVGKGTVTLDDFAAADVIVVIGQNPGTNHPRMLSTLQNAKRNGASIIHINPLPETGLERFKHPQEFRGWITRGTKLADMHIPVRVNGDVALLKGVAKALLEAEEERGGVLDNEFIDKKTEGFESFAADVRAAAWDDIERGSGVERDLIVMAADTLAATNKIIFCWAMGLTQHENAVANIQSITNLLLMKGAIGLKGAGACPVRGHSNVQGCRTVGITPRPSKAFLARLYHRYGFKPPNEHGLDTVDTIRAMKEGRVKVLFALGGNILSAGPDTDFTAGALRSCRLTAHVSTKLNRAHLVTGETALILPVLGRTERDVQNGVEQFVSVENSMGIVHASKGDLDPASENLLSEPRLVTQLADAVLGKRLSMDWLSMFRHYDDIREEIAATIPGFEAYNIRVRRPGGFYLPNAARDGRFMTPSGKAYFTVHELPPERLSADEFLLMTIRSHDQYNTTIYGLDDRYRGIKGGRKVIFMNEEDSRQAGLTEGDVVDIVNEHGGQRRTASRFRVVPFDIPRRCVAAYFPEANVLVPIDQVAKKSNTPASKSVVVRVIKA